MGTARTASMHVERGNCNTLLTLRHGSYIIRGTVDRGPVDTQRVAVAAHFVDRSLRRRPTHVADGWGMADPLALPPSRRTGRMLGCCAYE